MCGNALRPNTSHPLHGQSAAFFISAMHSSATNKWRECTSRLRGKRLYARRMETELAELREHRRISRTNRWNMFCALRSLRRFTDSWSVASGIPGRHHTNPLSLNFSVPRRCRRRRRRIFSFSRSFLLHFIFTLSSLANGKWIMTIRRGSCARYGVAAFVLFSLFNK